MRADQYDRLKALSEDLTDVVLLEADPKLWDKYTLKVSRTGARYYESDKARHWQKKNASATLNILIRIHSLVNIIERRSVTVEPPASEDDAAERLIEESRKSVEKIIERLTHHADD